MYSFFDTPMHHLILLLTYSTLEEQDPCCMVGCDFTAWTQIIPQFIIWLLIATHLLTICDPWQEHKVTGDIALQVIGTNKSFWPFIITIAELMETSNTDTLASTGLWLKSNNQFGVYKSAIIAIHAHATSTNIYKCLMLQYVITSWTIFQPCFICSSQ